MDVFDNTSSAEIRITDDRLKWLSLEHMGKMSNRTLCLMPLSLCITIILGLTTSEPKAAFRQSVEFWRAVWLLLLFGFGTWFLTCVFRYNLRPVRLEHFISACKADKPKK